MILCIPDILPPPLVESLRTYMAEAPLVDGAETAGWGARAVKANRQVAGGAPGLAALQAQVTAALEAHPVLALAARPKSIRPPLLSRYDPGLEYGTHVDDALMGGTRTDLSVTIFLSDPAAYDGGALVMEMADGERAFRLAPGSAVLYPATTLHRVAPVTRGTRLAAVTWIRSLIRSAEQREILFDLDRTRRSMFAAQGKTEGFDLLSKSVANLLRMWAED